MQLESIEVIPVNIPMVAPIRWAWGVREGITRNVVRLRFSNGLVSYGETMGGADVAQMIHGLFDRLRGTDAHEVTQVARHGQFLPYFSGYKGYAAIAGLEMAVWDGLGRLHEQPLHRLLGGAVRHRIPFSAYVFYRYPAVRGGKGGAAGGDPAGDKAGGPARDPAGEQSGAQSSEQGGEETPEQIAAYCEKLRQRDGFEVFKLKAGVFPPGHDVQTLEAIRKRLGPNVQLRVDPNGVWRPETTLQVADALKRVGLEYLEDPTWGLEAMARLRREIAIPMATNMCVVEFDQIPLAVRLGAVDVILADLHKWGGIRATQRLAAVADTFRLGLSIHSGVELGLSTAANLHLAAALPEVTYAIDSHYPHQADDILVGGKLAFEGGCMRVPEGPGLGVEVDPDRLAHYHERYRKDGAYPGMNDRRRPAWVPERQMW